MGRNGIITVDEPSDWTMSEAVKVFRKLGPVLEALQISRSQLARSVGVSRRSVYRWLEGCGMDFFHAFKLAGVLQSRARYVAEIREEPLENGGLDLDDIERIVRSASEPLQDQRGEAFF